MTRDSPETYDFETSMDEITLADAAVDAATPARATPKQIVIAMSGHASADVSMMEYCVHFVLNARDDVHVVHFARGGTPVQTTVYGPARGVAGSYGVDEEEDVERAKERPGWRRAPLSAESVVERVGAGAGGARAGHEFDWFPEYVRAELLDRRMQGARVQAVRVDALSGTFSAGELIEKISEGAFSDAVTTNDNWSTIPKPDLIVMGCRGHGLVKRAVLGSVSQYVLNRVATPTMFFRETLPPIEGAVSEAVKQKLGGVDQRVVCIAMSGSNSSRRLVEFFVNDYIRKEDCVLLLHCASAQQRSQKDLTDADVEENIATAYKIVSEWLSSHPHPSGRVVRMSLGKDEGSNDIRDRVVEFIELTDVNLLVVGRAISSARFRAKFIAPFPQYCVCHAPCPVLVYNPPHTYAPACEPKPKSTPAAPSS